MQRGVFRLIKLFIEADWGRQKSEEEMKREEQESFRNLCLVMGIIYPVIYSCSYYFLNVVLGFQRVTINLFIGIPFMTLAFFIGLLQMDGKKFYISIFPVLLVGSVLDKYLSHMRH